MKNQEEMNLKIGKDNIDNWYNVQMNNFLSFDAYKNVNLCHREEIFKRMNNHNNLLTELLKNFNSIVETSPNNSIEVNNSLNLYKFQKSQQLESDMRKILNDNFSNAYDLSAKYYMNERVNKIVNKIDNIYISNLRNAYNYELPNRNIALRAWAEGAIAQSDVKKLVPMFNTFKEGNMIDPMRVVMQNIEKNYEEIKQCNKLQRYNVTGKWKKD